MNGVLGWFINAVPFNMILILYVIPSKLLCDFFQCTRARPVHGQHFTYVTYLFGYWVIKYHKQNKINQKHFRIICV